MSLNIKAQVNKEMEKKKKLVGSLCLSICLAALGP